MDQNGFNTYENTKSLRPSASHLIFKSSATTSVQALLAAPFRAFEC